MDIRKCLDGVTDIVSQTTLSLWRHCLSVDIVYQKNFKNMVFYRYFNFCCSLINKYFLFYRKMTFLIDNVV